VAGIYTARRQRAGLRDGGGGNRLGLTGRKRDRKEARRTRESTRVCCYNTRVRAPIMETSTAAATMDAGVQGIVDWWERVNASTAWQEHIFLGLATACAIIALVALVSHPSSSPPPPSPSSLLLRL
jgi:hypothetical protein